MKLTTKVLAILVFGITIITSNIGFCGASGKGGGDDISQEFRNIVHNLPQIIATKGMSEFPEIDLNKFQAATSDKNYKVELKSGLKVNGAPKVAVSYFELKLTQVDPDMWFAYNFLQDGELRKNGMAFHEVLVVMKIEGNDDFHISNRLLSKNNPNSEISPSKTIVSVGQITSVDFNSASAITSVNYADSTSTFYYCDDRRDISTCQVLGRPGRFYSLQELALLKPKLDRKAKWYGRLFYAGSPGSLVTGLALGPVTDGASILYGAAGMLFVGVGGGSAYYKSKSYNLVVDPRIQAGQNLVVENSKISQPGLRGNAEDLSRALLWLN